MDIPDEVIEQQRVFLESFIWGTLFSTFFIFLLVNETHIIFKIVWIIALIIYLPLTIIAFILWLWNYNEYYV